MSTQPTMPLVDLMRIRYMKGEPLLQQGDTFDVAPLLEAMQIINDEAAAKNMAAPVAIAQPR